MSGCGVEGAVRNGTDRSGEDCNMPWKKSTRMKIKKEGNKKRLNRHVENETSAAYPDMHRSERPHIRRDDCLRH